MNRIFWETGRIATFGGIFSKIFVFFIFGALFLIRSLWGGGEGSFLEHLEHRRFHLLPLVRDYFFSGRRVQSRPLIRQGANIYFNELIPLRQEWKFIPGMVPDGGSFDGLFGLFFNSRSGDLTIPYAFYTGTVYGMVHAVSEAGDELLIGESRWGGSLLDWEHPRLYRVGKGGPTPQPIFRRWAHRVDLEIFNLCRGILSPMAGENHHPQGDLEVMFLDDLLKIGIRGLGFGSGAESSPILPPFQPGSLSAHIEWRRRQRMVAVAITQSSPDGATFVWLASSTFAFD